jgi:glycosyltransferase involved in cell wall biosynthesis
MTSRSSSWATGDNRAPSGTDRPRVSGRSRAAVSAAPPTQRRARVLIVGQGPPTAGGIPTFVTHLATDLALRARVEIEYLNTTPAGDKRPGRFTAGNLRQLMSDARAVFRRGAGVDVVHLNLAPAPMLPLLRALVLAATARLRRTRVVVHAHSGRLTGCLGRRDYRIGFRLLCAIVSAFVVVSAEAEKAGRKISGKVVRVPNGIDLPPARWAGPPERPTVAFVGTVSERKGLIDLRDALVVLRERSALSPAVWIVGDARQEGPGAFDRVRDEFSTANLDEAEFLGRVPRDEVLDLLTRCTVFCLPSHWEGSPLSVLEAMAVGAPVVASAVGDVPELLDHGAAGIVVPAHDPDALADALESVLRDPTEARRLSAAARDRVADLYSWRATVDRVAALYERVAGYSR